MKMKPALCILVTLMALGSRDVLSVTPPLKNDFEQAKQAFELGLKEDALSLLKRQQVDSPSAEMIDLLVRVNLSLGDRRAALEPLLRGWEEGTDRAAKRMWENKVRVVSRSFFTQESVQRFHGALRYMERGEWSTAAEGLAGVLKLESQNVEVIVRLAQAYWYMGHFSEAWDVLIQVESLLPIDLELQIWRARIEMAYPEHLLTGVRRLEAIRDRKGTALSPRARSQIILWLADHYSKVSDKNSLQKLLGGPQPKWKAETPYDSSLGLLIDFRRWESSLLPRWSQKWLREGASLKLRADNLLNKLEKHPVPPFLLSGNLELIPIPELLNYSKRIEDLLRIAALPPKKPRQ